MLKALYLQTLQSMESTQAVLEERVPPPQRVPILDSIFAKSFLYTRDGKIHLQSIFESHPSISIALEDVDKIHPIALIANNALWVNDGDLKYAVVAMVIS